MRRSRRPLVIASRRSALARAQAEAVGAALARLHRGLAVEYRWIESEGDRHKDAPLSQAGGKGLFVRAIERAVLSGEADLAVHSLKDLPARPETPGLTIAAVPRRADVRDCLVAAGGAAALDELPDGAVLGTASPRRAAQALRLRPDLRIRLIRGNVESRLGKVLAPQGPRGYDATLLAVAGLERAGLREHAAHAIDAGVILPAACQGALALQCRAHDHVTLTRCLPLNHAVSAAAVHAERQVVAGLEGDCDSPIAALVEPEGQGYRLRARVLSADGSRCLEVEQRAAAGALAKAARTAVRALLDLGAAEVLAKRPAPAIPAGAAAPAPLTPPLRRTASD